MGITDIVSDYIRAVILAYSKALDKSKVNISLKNLKLEIRDLELYKFALMQHGVPIVVNRGSIGQIVVEFPSALRIFSDPTRITIKDVVISASCCCGEDAEFPPFHEMWDIRTHELTAHELFKKTFYKAFTRISSHDFHALFVKIASKAIVVVENISINVDFGRSPEVVFFGVRISRLEMGSLSRLQNRGMDVERELVLKDFSLFMQKDSRPLDFTTQAGLARDIETRFSEVDEFIIPPQDISAALHYSREKAKLFLDLDIRELGIDVQEWQLRFLVSLIPSYQRFRRYWKTIAVPRPKTESPEDLWEFVHTSACRLKERERSKFEDFVRLFRARSAYMRLYARQKDEDVSDFLSVIDHQLEYHQVIIFRLLAERRMSKWIKKDLSRNDVYDAFEFCDVDHKNLLQFFLRNSVVKVTSETIGVRLHFDGGNGVLMGSLALPQIQMRMSVYGFNLVASFSSFSAVYENDGVEEKLLESVDRSQMDFNFDVTLCKPWTFYSLMITATLSPSLISVDMGNCFALLRNTRIFEYFRLILACIDLDLRSVRPIFFDCEMKTAQILLRTAPPCYFKIVFDAFSIKTISEQTTILALSNVNVLFGNTIESVIVTSFSFNGIYNDKTLALTTSPLAVSLCWSDASALIQIAKQVLDIIAFVLEFEFETFHLPEMSIEITIPYVEMALDVLEAKDVLVFLVQTVILDCKLPALTFSGSAEGIYMPKDSKVERIQFTYEDGYADFVMDSLRVSMFGLISILPKDLMKIVSLDPLSVNFGFLFKKSKIDLRIDGINEVIDFEVTNWRGKMNEHSLEMDGVVDAINFCGSPLFENVPYNSSIELDKAIKVNIHFRSMIMLFKMELIRFALNAVFPLEELFPVGLDFHWFIRIDNLSIPRVLRIEDVLFQFTMNSESLIAHLAAGALGLSFGKCSGSHPVALSFDFNRKYFEVITNLEVMEIELSQSLTIVRKVLKDPIMLTLPIVLDLRMLPTVFKVRIEDRVVEADMGQVMLRLDGERHKIEGTFGGISMKMGTRPIATMVNLTVTTREEIVLQLAKGYLNVDKFVIKELFETLKIVRRQVLHNIESVCSSQPFLVVPLRCRVDSYDVFIHNTLSLTAENCNVLVNLPHVSLKTDWCVHVMSSFFEQETLVQKTSCEMSWDIKNRGKVTCKAIPVIVTPKAIRKMIKASVLERRLHPPFVIVNNTDIDFDCDLGVISGRSSLFTPDMPHLERFELQSELGAIPFCRNSFAYGAEMKATFPTGESLVLRVKKHELWIDSRFEVVNDSRYAFDLQFGSISQSLEPYSRIPMERQRGEFKLNSFRFYLHISRYYHIEVNNEYLCICDTGSTVTIRPLLFVRNLLPFSIDISNEFATVTIAKNTAKPCPFITPWSSHMHAFIEGGQFQETEVKINLGKLYSTISMQGENGIDIKVRVQTKQKKGSYYITLLPCAVFHNHLTIPIHASFSRTSKHESRVPINSDTLFSPTKAFHYVMYIWFSNVATSLDLREEEIRKQLIVRHGNSFAFVDFVTKIEPKKFWNVLHVHFYPSYVIENRTGSRLHILTSSSRIDIEDGILYPLMQHDKTKDFAFALDSSDYTRNFNLDTITSQITSISTCFYPVSVEVNQRENGKLITFKTMRDFSCRIKNDTDSFLSVGQTVSDQVEVLPYSSLFYIPHSFDKTIKIWVSRTDKTFELMPGESALPTVFGLYRYWSVRYPSGVTEIVLADQAASAECLPKFSISTTLSEIAIKMFSSDLAPLVLSRVAGVHISLSCDGTCGIRLNFEVESVKAEDISSRQILRSLDYPFCSFQTTLVGPRLDQFDAIILTLTPFFVRLDPGFASHYFIPFGKKAIPGSPSLLRFRELQIASTFFYFSYQCGMRLAKPFPQVLRLLPTVLPFKTRTKALSLGPFEGTTGDLARAIANQKVVSMRRFIFNVIGSSTIIGAPWNYIVRLFRECGRRSKLLAPYLLTRGAAGIVIGIVESFLDYLSSILRFFGGQEITPKDTNSPLLWGLTSLFFTVVSGVMSCLQAPERGWKDLGLMGVVYETVISLVRLIFVIGSGGVDSVSGILCFLRQTICEELEEEAFID